MFATVEKLVTILFMPLVTKMGWNDEIFWKNSQRKRNYLENLGNILVYNYYIQNEENYEEFIKK